MAPKKSPAFERLLNASRKAGTIKRKPYAIRTKRLVVIKPTAAERLAKKLQRRERKQSYKSAIADAHQKIQELAEEIHAKFGSFTLERVVTDIFQTKRLKDSSKEISRYAAFTSSQMKILNAGTPSNCLSIVYVLRYKKTATPEGQPRQKVGQLSSIIAEKWRGMTEEEKVAATEGDMASLRSRRESKELGSWHNADITASRDTSITVSRIKDEVSSLSSVDPASAN